MDCGVKMNLVKLSVFFLFILAIASLLAGCSITTNTSTLNQTNSGDIDDAMNRFREKQKSSNYTDDEDKFLPVMKNVKEMIGAGIAHITQKDQADKKTPLVGLTTLLDVTKQYNGFAHFELKHFPQQANSNKKILLLESLAKGLSQTASMDKKGYVALNSGNKKQQTASIQQSNLNRRTMISAKKPFHDVNVSMYASKGIAGVFDGYLDYANSEIQPFGVSFGVDADTKIDEVSDIYQTVINYRKQDFAIVSMSFYPAADNLEELSRIASSLTTKQGGFVSLFSGSIKAQNNEEEIDPVIAINEADLIWLISLDNEDWSSDEVQNNIIIEKLKLLQQSIPNILYVSSTPYDLDKKTYTRDRARLVAAGLKVYTLLAPAYDFGVAVVDSKATLSLDAPKSGAMSTSIATPILSTIIHNAWSISPNLNARQIVSMLQETAKTGESNIYGYVVDPESLYKYVIGNAISHSYMNQIYPELTDHILEYDNGVWSIKPKRTNSTKNLNTKQRLLNIKMDNIFVSSMNNGVTRIKKKTQPKNKTSNSLATIRIKIDDIEYDIVEQEIRVQITKRYESFYRDETVKEITLKFDETGPEYYSEYPIITKPIKQLAKK